MTVATVSIKSAGSTVPEHFPLVGVDIRRALNRQPTATLIYQDGDAATREFALSDSAHFKPGTPIEILVRYEGAPGPDGQDAPLFKGLVARHGIEADARGSMLRVELRDKAICLTRPRRSRVAVDSRDSELLTKLLKEAGLKASVDDTPLKHASLVQYDCSDWDWLLTRAEANGLVVVVHDGAVQVTAPDTSAGADLKLEYGIDSIFDLEFECDATGQDSGYSARHWDPAQQTAPDATGQAAARPSQGQADGPGLARKLGFDAATLVSAVPLPPAEAKAWATGEALRTQLAMLRGRLRVQGTAKPALLDMVEVAGVAKAFNGKALVSGLCHRIDAGGWTTDLQFGLSPQPHRSRPDIAQPAASGLLPAVGGLQVGVVVATHDDPGKEHRVKVKLVGLGSDAEAVWARMASPDAGKGHGWYFWPLPGDEVVLGFFNDDPRQPVVLGSLYSSKQPPPQAIVDASDKNSLRGLVTPSGLTLGLQDKDGESQLFLQTKGGAKLLLDDKDEAIVLSDKHGNQIKLDKDGITLKSAKDFKVDASGNVEIKGTQVDIK